MSNSISPENGHSGSVESSSMEHHPAMLVEGSAISLPESRLPFNAHRCLVTEETRKAMDTALNVPVPQHLQNLQWDKVLGSSITAMAPPHPRQPHFPAPSSSSSASDMVQAEPMLVDETGDLGRGKRTSSCQPQLERSCSGRTIKRQIPFTPPSQEKVRRKRKFLVAPEDLDPFVCEVEEANERDHQVEEKDDADPVPEGNSDDIMVNGDEQSDNMNTTAVNENAIPPPMAEGSLLAPRFRCPFDECKWWSTSQSLNQHLFFFLGGGHTGC